MKFTRKNGKSSGNKTRKARGSMSVKKDIVTYMLQMLMTVKLYHWNTLIHSVHIATDELYGSLNTLIDQFVEVLLGKHTNISEKNKHDILNIKTLHLNNYKDNVKFKKELEGYKKYLIHMDKYFSKVENSDLFNIRDEILAVLNKISYLLTLK
jgi:hypothetical protein